MRIVRKDSDYAIRAIKYIQRSSSKIVPVSLIEKELSVSKAFLRKILQILSKNNILDSHRGNGGGFSLTPETSKIKVLDIIKLFQGDISLTNCEVNGKLCPESGHCKMRKTLLKAEKTLRKEFQTLHVLDK